MRGITRIINIMRSHFYLTIGLRLSNSERNILPSHLLLLFMLTEKSGKRIIAPAEASTVER